MLIEKTIKMHSMMWLEVSKQSDNPNTSYLETLRELEKDSQEETLGVQEIEEELDYI